ncbi:MAG: RNA polymerase sigma factor RpoE [Pseudomonadales bacterium]
MATAGAELSDIQLVKRVQKGDKQAFDMLVLKYQYKVQAVISRFVKDQSEVQDVAQEAFIKAYRAIQSFRGESQFYTWLYRIAVNTAKNYLVTRNRRPPNDDIDIGDAENYGGSEYLKDNDTPEGEMYRGELEEVVFKALSELPEDLRTAVTLREMEGMSYEEIASIMDCPVGTVRSRIFRAREAITEKIKPLID